MVRLSVAKVTSLMERPGCIRNVSVIGPFQHGKSTLVDSLAGKASGPNNSETRHDDRIHDSVRMHSLCYENDGQHRQQVSGEEQAEVGCGGDTSNGLLINLLDCPGHVDFSAETTTALRVTDGAVLVVDCTSGMGKQTELNLRQAINERVKPVLFLNKMDLALLKEQDPEDLYRYLRRHVEHVNSIITTYTDDTVSMGLLELDPSSGNVAFGSGSQGWAFTLEQFAERYSRKLGLSVDVMMKYLWGDHFYDPGTKEWTDTPATNSKRGFVMFVLEPLMKVIDATKGKKLNKVKNMAAGVKLPDNWISIDSEELMKVFLQSFLPVRKIMIGMMYKHLPSPVTAQKYRTDMLYEGPLDDKVATAMKDCDSHSPLMMYVSKMIPNSDKSRFYAFGRVFSGKVTAGAKVRVQGPRHIVSQQSDIHERVVIHQSFVVCGIGMEPVAEIPAGNLAMLEGVDEHLVKTGTISTFHSPHGIRLMRFTMSPLVRVAVQPKNPDDLPKLIDGLQRLEKSDPLMQCITEYYTEERFVAGTGELHLNKCLSDLAVVYACIPLTVSEPIASYRETVTAESSQTCMSKSPNKLNRIFCTASPLPIALASAMESDAATGLEERIQTEYADIEHRRQVWSCDSQSPGTVCNMLVDQGKKSDWMIETVREYVEYALRMVSQEGVLCDEPTVGVRFNVLDVFLHIDDRRRTKGQMISMTRRATLGAVVAAQPRLMEHFYLVELQCPHETVASVTEILRIRRGRVFEERKNPYTSLIDLKAHIPLVESFGLSKEFPIDVSVQCIQDHWAIIRDDPLDKSTRVAQIVADIRKRKGLEEEIPPLDKFLDKIRS